MHARHSQPDRLPDAGAGMDTMAGILFLILVLSTCVPKYFLGRSYESGDANVSAASLLS